MTSVLLFVYGSLKRDGEHHAELRGARFVAEARTAAGYALSSLGRYLALSAEPNSVDAVSGELFEVPMEMLEGLDAFEGEGYERGLVALSPAHSSGFREALAYFRKSR